MVKKYNWSEIMIVLITMIFIVAISTYHSSYNGKFSLSLSDWNTLGMITLNLFILFIVWLVGYITSGIIRITFWGLVPYFIVKLIYHISCELGIYLKSKEWWESLFSTICIVTIICILVIIILKSFGVWIRKRSKRIGSAF